MRLPALLLTVGAVVLPPTGGATPLTDDSGTTVDVDDLTRVVVTSTDLAEIFVALGQGARLAAIPAWVESSTSCVRAPPGLEGIPRIGRPHVILAETIVDLDPTLVIEKDHPLQPTPLAGQLRSAGIDVFYVDNEETLENVHHTIFAVARLLETVDPGVQTKAQDLSRSFNATLADVATRVANATWKPRTVFQLPSALVAGRGTSADVLIRLAGGVNVADGLQGYKQMSGEALASADPERVILSCTAGGNAQSLFSAPKYAPSTAARLQPNSLRIVDPAVTALVGPRFADGVRATAQWLHAASFGLLTPNVTHAMVGPVLTVDANGTLAQSEPITFLFDAGDGSPAASASTARFEHRYDSPGAYTARLLIIDGAGRVHEERFPVQVDGARATSSLSLLLALLAVATVAASPVAKS